MLSDEKLSTWHVRAICPEPDKMAEVLLDAGHFDSYAVAERLGNVILTCMVCTYSSTANVAVTMSVVRRAAQTLWLAVGDVMSKCTGR